jgi:hypothetical protein
MDIGSWKDLRGGILPSLAFVTPTRDWRLATGHEHEHDDTQRTSSAASVLWHNHNNNNTIVVVQ